MRTFKHIAEVVKVNRQKKGISQSNLSHAIGYKNGQFISNVERGLCSIPPKQIQQLSVELNINSKLIKAAVLKDYADYLGISVKL